MYLWGVFTRYAIGSQASWSEELARFLLDLDRHILGAAYASGQKMHLAINLLSPKLKPDAAQAPETFHFLSHHPICTTGYGSRRNPADVYHSGSGAIIACSADTHVAGL